MIIELGGAGDFALGPHDRLCRQQVEHILHKAQLAFDALLENEL
jgi:hypothetical protein